jgi:hypothetical protein
MSDIGELMDSYTAWRGRRFPPGSSDDSLAELHADLALADTWVADAVIPYVERGVHQRAQVDVLGGLSKIRNRAIELRGRTRGEDTRVADSYRDYADLLVRVYRSFLAHEP